MAAMDREAITAQDVARYILAFAHDAGSFISNLKLQKLLYYAQAWHLAIHLKPIFPEKFQAWVHGPVVPSVYREYKSYRWMNIDSDVAKPEFDEVLSGHLNDVLDEYMGLDAYKLEQLTHMESPWLKARAGRAPDENCSDEIEEAEMIRCYGARLDAPV